MNVARTGNERWAGGTGWVEWLDSVAARVELTPVRVAVLYLVLGFAGLYLSDVLLPALLADPLLVRVQAVKGGVEVVLTGGLIYALTRASRASLRRTNDELEAARRELGVLHRVLRHNLRNNLTVIAGYADQIESEAEVSHLEDYCDEIKKTCEEFTGSVEKTKHLSDLHANGLRAQELDLSVVLDRVRADAARQYPDATVDVDWQEPPEVLAHEHVEFALRELVDNAVVHDPSESPTVEVTAEQPPGDASVVHIRVEDEGSGIPEAEREALRQRGETPLVHGSGVGLWVARWIVLQSGGSFEVENTGDGCRVTVTLPTARQSSLDGAEPEFAAILE